jgi:hypothetical protein
MRTTGMCPDGLRFKAVCSYEERKENRNVYEGDRQYQFPVISVLRRWRLEDLQSQLHSDTLSQNKTKTTQKRIHHLSYKLSVREYRRLINISEKVL